MVGKNTDNHDTSFTVSVDLIAMDALLEFLHLIDPKQSKHLLTLKQILKILEDQDIFFH